MHKKSMKKVYLITKYDEEHPEIAHIYDLEKEEYSTIIVKFVEWKRWTCEFNIYLTVIG